jgi:uncharacterized protein
LCLGHRMKPLEYRSTFETRATDDGGGISGYSSTFWAVDAYYTAMAPGAFQRSLAERGDRIPVLYNHWPDLNIGIPDAQREDDKGLYLEATIFDDGADGTILMKRLRAGARYGFSFGFRTLADRAATEEDPLDFAQLPNVNRGEVRVITEVKLYEHSVVTFPANEKAEIEGVRHAATADALRFLLDDIRENRLTDAERELVGRIVAAFPGASDADRAPGPDRMARRFDAEAALAQLRYLTPYAERNTA